MGFFFSSTTGCLSAVTHLPFTFLYIFSSSSQPRKELAGSRVRRLRGATDAVFLDRKLRTEEEVTGTAWQPSYSRQRYRLPISFVASPWSSSFGQVLSSKRHKEFVNWPPFDQAVITATMHQMLSITSFWSCGSMLVICLTVCKKNYIQCFVLSLSVTYLSEKGPFGTSPDCKIWNVIEITIHLQITFCKSL